MTKSVSANEAAAAREPNRVDIHVGSRMRLRRLLIGMSQEKLGEALGVTFQQVQKYERGTNRIGASRLWDVGQVLEVPISFFFEGLGGYDREGLRGVAEEDGLEPLVYDFISSSEGVQLAAAFAKIDNSKVRRKLLELIRILADEEAGH